MNVIDTVGCGDSFVAAVAFGFIHNLPLVYTLTIANAVGAATAMGCGAGRNVATLGQVVEIITGLNLDEDDKFWDELLNGDFGVQEITLLTKMVVNGSKIQPTRTSLPKVVSELLPVLECTPKEQAYTSYVYKC